MKKFLLRESQIIDLRNSLIINEALEEESANMADSSISADYNDYAVSKINKSTVEGDDKKDSEIFGQITKVLYNYFNTNDLSNKISIEVSKLDDNYNNASTKEFIDKLLYGIYRMSSDPSQNDAFIRFLRSIGVTLDANLLIKGK